MGNEEFKKYVTIVHYHNFFINFILVSIIFILLSYILHISNVIQFIAITAIAGLSLITEILRIKLLYNFTRAA